MLTSDLNLSKNCKRIEILKCVLRTFIIIIIIIIPQSSCPAEIVLNVKSLVTS